MDIFAHALWTEAIYKKATKRKQTLWEIVQIVFWSNVPDFFTFTILFFVNLFSLHTVWHGEAYFIEHTPPWFYALHHIFYSLPFFFLMFGLVWAILRKPYWPMGGWFIHIAIDIFTHKNFFPPHFLWPFYPDIHFEVISWANPVFMTVNYTLLVAVYGYWFYRHKRRKGPEKQ